MPLPLVAIVGRPNVGKSSLLNMLAGRRISIVDPTAGVTRDRVQTLCEHGGIFFELVDTGGYGIVDRDDLGGHVEQQIRFAVDQAALILFVVDARDGVTPLDQAVVGWLRECDRPVMLLANKVDARDMQTELHEFHRLGLGEPMPISAKNNLGRDELLDAIVEAVRPLSEGQAPGEPLMKVALVGKRNVGKSSFINALAGQERVIVSEVAGTTRDAIDVRFEIGDNAFMAIDTAGVRKKRKLSDDIEYYSMHRAELSIRRADVVLLLIESISPVGHVDKSLAGYIADQYKPCVIVINKWDLARDQASTEEFGDYLLQVMPGLSYAPVAFVTATQQRNTQTVIDLAASLFKQARTRVSTGQLNAAIEEIMSGNVPSPKRGAGRVKILYATQVAVCPPTIVCFVNDPSRVTPTYERFLLNRFRELLPFEEVPIRLLFRSRRSMKQRKDGARH